MAERRGRPKEHDEPQVKRTYEIKESLAEKLRDSPIARKNQTRFVNAAIQEKLSREDDETETEDSKSASVKTTVETTVKEMLAALGVVPASALVPRSDNETDPLANLKRIRVESRVAVPRADVVTLQRFGAVPCGPLADVMGEGEEYVLPRDLADILGAHDGDLMFPCRGQSMREAGIPDGALVTMRPLKGATPPDGSIVLACIEHEGGHWSATVKYLYRDARGHPDLRDGKLKPFVLPADFRELHIQAYLIGVMGQATKGNHTVKGRRALKDRPDRDDMGEQALSE